MRRALKILRILIACVLIMILAANLYFIGARLIGGESHPKLFGYSNAIVTSGSMSPAFEAGDLLIYREQESYCVNDIVIFTQGSSLVTHRIVGEDAGGFITQGDANNTPDSDLLEPQRIQGKMVLIVPRLGSFLLFLREPIGTICLIFLGLLLWEWPRISKLFKRKKGKYEA